MGNDPFVDAAESASFPLPVPAGGRKARKRNRSNASCPIWINNETTWYFIKIVGKLALIQQPPRCYARPSRWGVASEVSHFTRDILQETLHGQGPRLLALLAKLPREPRKDELLILILIQSWAVTVIPSEIWISQELWQVSQNGFGSP